MVGQSDQLTGSEALAGLAQRYWDRVLAENPVLATFYGVHDHDDRIDDLSEEAEAAFRSDLVSIRDSVESVEPGTLDATGGVTRALLLSRIEIRIEAIDLRLVELASDHMDGPHAQLLMAAPLLTYPEASHAEAALSRYGQIPRLLGQAADRFRAGLAAGRTPVGAVVARSLNSLDRYLESPLDQDPFLSASIPLEWSGRQAWHDSMTGLVQNQIRPALEVYRNVLRDELLPVGRDETHVGLCHLPEGDALYSAFIHSYTSTRATAAELHQVGRSITETSLPSEYSEIGSRWLDSLGPDRPQISASDSSDLFEFIRSTPLLRHKDAEEIVMIAERSIDRAQGSIDGWFGVLPQSACVVAEVPDFLAADSPYAYYFPAAPDGTRPGTYFINTADPTEASRAEAESIAFHEAIPGHHLQIAIGQELASSPEFQKHEGCTAFVEGWALYAERLADEIGLYSGEEARIGMLAADSWRSARLVVDTGIHALGWSRAEAIEYFREHTPVPMDQVESEVDRYIAIPGQALAYKVGQLEIERLRNRAQDGLGESFSISDFHDTVLGSAAVTLPVLEELVSSWMESV